MSISDKQRTLLHELARLYGIRTVYRDTEGRRRPAAPHALLAVLRALGAPVESVSDLGAAVRERRHDWWRRLCEPVIVVWDRRPTAFSLRLSSGVAEKTAECRLQLEDGRLLHRSFRPARLALQRRVCVEGTAYEIRRLVLPGGLPWGYHRMTLHLPPRTAEALVVVAPGRASRLPAGKRIWGGFLPLYALRTGRSGAAGDLTDLEALLDWIGKMGGDMVGTLPLLPNFLDEPFDPSPYAPVSRLFWNEFYLDLHRVEEVCRHPEARALLESPEYRRETAELSGAPLVDYRRGMALKRRVLESCARLFFAGGGRRQEALRRWADTHPRVHDYAAFRAAVEHQGAPWNEWPERMRNGTLQEGDYDPETARYHLYVQWLVDGQFRELSAKARQAGQSLYLDLPLGVHTAGYDVWRERAVFAADCSAGAPPDAFHRDGQDWGFSPLHPERIREQGYRYYIACLRHHLQRAGILRIDHVAGMHRLYWVPRGLSAAEGVYVRYRTEEFFAILTLESWRHRALIVGEDLGTVPDVVRRMMARHGIYGMYVLPFEFTGDFDKVLNPVGNGSLACLNTHDLPPFAAFWQEKLTDADRYVRTALPSYLYRQGWLKAPTAKTGAVLGGSLAHLAAGPAGILLVNLEDLWLETAPQNKPGSGEAYPNWRRKAYYALEEFAAMNGIESLLRRINLLRKTRRPVRFSRRRYTGRLYFRRRDNQR